MLPAFLVFFLPIQVIQFFINFRKSVISLDSTMKYQRIVSNDDDDWIDEEKINRKRKLSHLDLPSVRKKNQNKRKNHNNLSMRNGGMYFYFISSQISSFHLFHSLLFIQTPITIIHALFSSFVMVNCIFRLINVNVCVKSDFLCFRLLRFSSVRIIQQFGMDFKKIRADIEKRHQTVRGMLILHKSIHGTGMDAAEIYGWFLLF